MKTATFRTHPCAPHTRRCTQAFRVLTLPSEAPPTFLAVGQCRACALRHARLAGAAPLPLLGRRHGRTEPPAPAGAARQLVSSGSRVCGSLILAWSTLVALVTHPANLAAAGSADRDGSGQRSRGADCPGRLEVFDGVRPKQRSRTNAWMELSTHSLLVRDICQVHALRPDRRTRAGRPFAVDALPEGGYDRPARYSPPPSREHDICRQL